MRINLVLIAVIIAAFSACSTRIEYDRTPVFTPSQNPININTASVDEIEKLPGIGRKTAESIIIYRTENGPFRRVEHLMLIRGVSEARFMKLQPYIRAE